MARFSSLRVPPFGIAKPPQRVHPGGGAGLTICDIGGLWHPSSAVNACGMFAVRWSTSKGEYWAPLHDFTPAAQRCLIEECRRLDAIANGPEESRRAKRS